MTSAKFAPLLAALHYTFTYLYYCQADLISSRQPYRFFCPNIYLNPYYSENAQNASIVTTNNVQFSLAQKHPSYNLAASLAWETGTVMYNHGILDMRLQSISLNYSKKIDWRRMSTMPCNDWVSLKPRLPSTKIFKNAVLYSPDPPPLWEGGSGLK